MRCRNWGAKGLALACGMLLPAGVVLAQLEDTNGALLPPPIDALVDDDLVDVSPEAPGSLGAPAELDEALLDEESALTEESLEEAPAIREAKAPLQTKTPSVRRTANEPELVRERFPDGKIMVERHVIQDERQNYVNHGPWKMWDAKGTVIAEGEYHQGERQGEWVGWFFSAERPMLQGMPYKQFEAPFVSQAEFDHGALHGVWSIYDSKQRKVSEFQYENGRRHGVWIWNYPNGQLMRQITYVDGEIHGELIEWDAKGSVIGRDEYINGRRLAPETEMHADGTKKSSGMYLHASRVTNAPDSWQDCELAAFVTQGKDEKHGPWTSWHPNGQERMKGEYRHDVPVGVFTWWHANGQKALEGAYADGEQTGDWLWWHANGLKSIQGHYTGNNPSGKWIWWREDGQVAQRADFDKETETARIPASDIEGPGLLR